MITNIFKSHLVLLCLCLLLVNTTNCQSLKSIDVYEKSIKEYYVKKYQAERIEYLEQHRRELGYYLPDVGFTLGMPAINWRVSEYFKYKRDKKRIENKLLSIKLTHENEMNRNILETRIEYEKVKLHYEHLSYILEKDKKLEELFKISQECCVKRDCTPEECKKREIVRMGEIENMKSIDKELKISVLELEKMAKYDIPNYKF